MEERKKVLITGAAGRIGSSLRVLMKDRYRLRLMFHSKVLPVEEDEEVVIGDLCDFEEMSEACEGVDAVVHMGGLAGGGDFPGRLVPVNIVGTYNVFEAARQQGVHKVVFASTNHVTGMYEKEAVYTTPDMPVRPDSTYGVSKAAGAALARYYVDAFGMSIHCLRIARSSGEVRPKDGACDPSRRGSVRGIWPNSCGDVSSPICPSGSSTESPTTPGSTGISRTRES